MTTITVIGAGSWGTALAILLANNQHHVWLWGRSTEQITVMQQKKSNPFYIPDVKFPERLQVTTDLSACLEDADYVLIAIPSRGFREMLRTLRPFNKPLIWASKGIEPSSNKLLHHVITEELGADYPAALLTGPSFAKEVAHGLPTAVVIASPQQNYAEQIMTLFANPHFRPYYCLDLIGAEIGGAVKNVLAIAAGISDGLGFGANARAALITRGLHETTQLGLGLGAKLETGLGVSGMGDLVLTCTDNLSRNRRFGLALGAGKTVPQALADIGQVVEGADNVAQITALAQQQKISMPIIEQVQHVLNNTMSPLHAVEALFNRELKAE